MPSDGQEVSMWGCMCVMVNPHMDVGTPSEYATDWFGWGQWGVFDVEIIE